jgi:hypothetical protein
MLAMIANWGGSTEAHALLLRDLDVSGSARNSFGNAYLFSSIERLLLQRTLGGGLGSHFGDVMVLSC